MSDQLTSTTPDRYAHSLLTELQQIEESIKVTGCLMATLKDRRDVVFRRLDLVTRPAPVVPLRVAMTISRGAKYRGQLASLSSCIEVYLYVLRRLWQDYPELQDRIAQALGARGTYRSYVSRDRSSLFDGKSKYWGIRHSTLLVDGWYADTNLNPERIETLLQVAVNASGLRWGHDVKIFLQPISDYLHPASQSNIEDALTGMHVSAV